MGRPVDVDQPRGGGNIKGRVCKLIMETNGPGDPVEVSRFLITMKVPKTRKKPVKTIRKNFGAGKETDCLKSLTVKNRRSF